MSIRPSKVIERLIQQHRKWLERGDWFRQRQLRSIQEAMQDQTLTSLGLLAISVKSLGLFCGARGIVALRDGTDGWSDVAAALECYCWSSRLELASYYLWPASQRVRRRVFLLGALPRAVGVFSHVVSTGERARERELWALLEKPLLDDDSAVREWWYERHFESFFVSFYAKVRGQTTALDPERVNLGVYGRVLETWDDDAALAAALADVCDYHVQHTEDTRDRDAEFNRPPLDLIPVEVFAVNRLRADSGLRAVEVDHPLMTAIGPVVQAALPSEVVEILGRVRSKYENFYQ